MSDKKQETIYKNLEYIGKKKVGEGVYSKGKSEGKTWKRYVLTFKNGEFTKDISAFSPMGGKSMQIEDLEEDKVYNIGWNPGVKGKTAATAFFIGKESSDSNNKDTVQDAEKPTLKLDLSTFDEFKVNYLKLTEKAKIKPNLVHMIGSFIATKYEINELTKKCKGSLDYDK